MLNWADVRVLMKLVEHQAAFLMDLVKLLEVATASGFLVTGGELYRTAEQQEIYVKQGKSKTRDSNHLRRLAIDLHFFKGGKLVSSRDELRPVGEFWESLYPGVNRWGGNFKSIVDTPHFERNA